MHGGKFISLLGRLSTKARKKKILLNNLISTDIACYRTSLAKHIPFTYFLLQKGQ